MDDFELLTQEDKNRIQELNQKHSYGLSKSMLKALISKHKKAKNSNDNQTIQEIEYRLTDINFHYECGLLSTGKYKEAFESLKKWDEL